MLSRLRLSKGTPCFLFSEVGVVFLIRVFRSCDKFANFVMSVNCSDSESKWYSTHLGVVAEVGLKLSSRI